MPPVIESSARIDDSYRVVDEGALPEHADIIVSLERWLREREFLRVHRGRIGVALAPGDDPELLAEDVERLALIVLCFPQFTDGRAYSQARILRERLGFAGKIRATGDVLPDQLEFMRRCGIDSFEFPDEPSAERALRHSPRFSVAHRQAAGEAIPAYRHRA